MHIKVLTKSDKKYWPAIRQIVHGYPPKHIVWLSLDINISNTIIKLRKFLGGVNS